MKSLSRLEPLTDAQRSQIADWLQDYHSYEKIIALAREQFGVEIPRMTLSRYRSRLALIEFFDDDSPESAAAAAEIVQYTATCQDKFSPATLHVLERKAFELSLTCVQQDEDMGALKNISAILCRHRNTTVRERLAAVQEEKCRLRHQEHKLKAVIHGTPVPEETALPNPAPGTGHANPKDLVPTSNSDSNSPGGRAEDSISNLVSEPGDFRDSLCPGRFSTDSDPVAGQEFDSQVGSASHESDGICATPG